jgi:hypothetical protein
MAGKGQITEKYGKKQVEMWNDMENLENTEENSEKICKIWKKPKLKCEMI